MALTEYQRNRIAHLKIRIEYLRKDLETLKNRKKSISEHYANLIKGTRDANQKRSYRQSKISQINSLENQISSKKREIERIKEEIKSIKR
jgi:archaellum component FlaC